MQITEQIVWENLSKGFHGGYFDSNEICTFDEDNEKQFVCFSVREYTSDHEDFFGVCCPMWEIYLWLREVRNIEGEQEYETEVKYRVGDDFCRAEYAQEFCEYILYSIKKHGNLSRLPISERVED